MNDFAWSAVAALRIDGVPCITTWTLSNDCDLKFASSKADARVDSELGVSKLVVKLFPNAPATTLTPMSVPTHTRTTRRRRR